MSCALAGTINNPDTATVTRRQSFIVGEPLLVRTHRQETVSIDRSRSHMVDSLLLDFHGGESMAITLTISFHGGSGGVNNLQNCPPGTDILDTKGVQLDEL